MVPVPVPTFEKVMVPVPVPALYLDHKKQIVKKNFGIFFTFYLVSSFTRKKFMNFNKFMFNEGNQIYNFMSSSGSETVINYGSGSSSDFLTSYGSGYSSGSTSQKVTFPTIPVPQHCFDMSQSVSQIRIHRIHVFLGLLDPVPDPDSSIIKHSSIIC
jgi:hypothetical protein